MFRTLIEMSISFALGYGLRGMILLGRNFGMTMEEWLKEVGDDPNEAVWWWE